MSAKILQGEEIAQKILQDLKDRVAGKQLKLAVVQVGQNAVSETYIHKKKDAAAELGVHFELYKLLEDISQTELKSRVESIGADSTVSGVIVQLSLPKHINQREVLDVIPLEKDVDVLSSAAFGLFALGGSKILPPTVGAVSLLLQDCGVKLKGKNVAIIGAGRLVGMPLAIWCVREKAIVTVANEHTQDLASITKNADILISGVGKKGLIKGNMVKKGALVIDAGTSVEQGTSFGDVDFESVVKKAGFVTPVPGGVGPLTVACLLKNLFTLHTT